MSDEALETALASGQVLRPGDRVIIDVTDLGAEQVQQWAEGLRERFPDVGFVFTAGAEIRLVVPEPDLGNWFTYHPPADGDPAIYQTIRSAGHSLAEVIEAVVGPCREREIAFEKIREAVMWANAGRACNPAPVEEG